MPKPLPTRFTQKRLGGKPMTIGIGMLCAGGAIIAADTRAVYSDGSTSHIRKVTIAQSDDAAFVAAFASSDVPSTETLLSDIFSKLKQHRVTTLRACEESVRSQMLKWDAAHPHGAPDTEFIFGAALLEGHALYHCRPPNSMNPKPYIAIGQGAAIVDPLHSILFRDQKGPRTTLRQMAYLMFRAKTDYGSACGGKTNAIFLKSDPPSAFEIGTASMAIAELSGTHIDAALRETTGSLFSGALPTETKAINNAAQSLKSKGFLTNARQVIEEDGTIRQLPPPN